jgi:DNA-binding Lrp family transcriptional regulator
VLDALTRNPRISAAAIGAAGGVSTDTVLARMRAFERERVIIRYSLVTDVRKLNHVNFFVLLYLNDLTPQREAQLCDFCRSEPHVVYMIKSLGEWDYELSVEAPTVQDYRAVMMRLTKDFSDIVQEYNGMLVESIEKYVYP